MNTRYGCTDCGKRFILKGNLVYHQRFDCSVQPKYECPYCGHRFKHPFSIMKHVNMCLASFACSLNIDGLPKKISCTSNIYESYSCADCGGSYKRKSHLIRHLMQECGQKSNFNSVRLQSAVKQPKIPHVPNIYKKYNCENCSKAYKRKETLSRHLSLDCGREPRFACLYCDYRANWAGNVKRHVKNKHSEEKISFDLAHSKNGTTQPKIIYVPNIYKTYTCADCGRSYEYKHHLSRHLSSQCGQLSFGCPCCDHRCKQKLAMKKHIDKCVASFAHSLNIVEQREIPYIPNVYELYSCSSCGQSYKRKGNLSRHLLSECGRESSFGCFFCDYSSKYPSVVMKHISRVHPANKVVIADSRIARSAGKPPRNTRYVANCYERYSCADCGRSYKLKWVLQRHVGFQCGRRSIHERRFCDQHSGSAASKRKHIQRAHSTRNCATNFTHPQNVAKLSKNPRYVPNVYERYGCANCGRSYECKRYLSRHLKVCGQEPRFGCPSMNEKDVKRHIRRVHSTKEISVNELQDEKYCCANCGSMYKTKSTLNRHQRLDCDKGPSLVVPSAIVPRK